MEPGAQLHNAILWNHAHVSSHADVHDAIIAENTTISGSASHIAIRADDGLTSSEIYALRETGWAPEQTTMHVLSARGSERAFYRLTRRTQSVMLVRYSAVRQENTLYADHIRFLHSLDIRVPELLYHNPDESFLLMQDLGYTDLMSVATHPQTRHTENIYRAILKQMLIFHEHGYRAAQNKHIKLCPPFSTKLWKSERELFLRNFVQEERKGNAALIKAARQELQRLSRKLRKPSPVLLHRDLQSSNIFLRRGQPYLIDFQGMRFGPAVYDLASLLCDPYVMLPVSLQESLIRFYAERAAPTSYIDDLFWWGAVQRLAQALGAYIRLGRQPGTESFLAFIPPACEMMQRALSHIGDFPALFDCVQSR